MKKRLAAVITMLFMIISGFPNVHAEDNAFAVTIEAQSEHIGNYFYEGDEPAFSITLQNNLDSAVDATLNIVVADEAEVVAGSLSRTVQLDGKQTRIIGFNPDMTDKFGVYAVTATMSDAEHIATAELKFSYTERHTSGLDDLGYMCHFSKTDAKYAREELSGELLKESGAGWVRDEINWDNVETVKGKYVIPERYENSVNRAIASGKKVMLLVTGGNKLYETGIGPNGEAISCLPVTQEGIQGFASFSAFVAEHFKGRVDTFEIWNEPDWISFSGHYDWFPENTGESWRNLAIKSADAYANLIKAVYPAIKNVYKGEEDKVTVVSGGSLPVKSDTGYLYRMLSKEGVQDYMDAVAVHPYAIDATPGDLCSGDSQDFTAQMRRVKSFTDKPIYLTEYGASSFGDSTNGGYDGVSNFKGYGTLGIDGQAMSLVRAYMVVACDPQIEKLFIYNFKEKNEMPSIEANFGAVGYDYTPKRAYAAVSAMSSILKNAEATKLIEANETNYAFGDRAKIYEFADKKNGDEIFVVAAGGSAFEWGTKLKITQNADPVSGGAAAVLDNTNKSVTVDAYSGGSVKVYDMMGNEIQPTDGVYPIYLAPMYVVCSKPYESVVADGGTVNVRGDGAEAYGTVTALVHKKNVIGQSVAYIDQLCADKYGRYEFSFEKTNGDIYNIRVYNGNVYTNNRYDLEKYDIDMRYYVDDTPLSDVSDIKPGTMVKIEAEIVDKLKTGDELIAYGCVYGNNAVMLESDMTSTEWTDNKAVLTTEISITDESDISSLNFMLWDARMHPVLNKVQGN